jgi:hypothetical protein
MVRAMINASSLAGALHDYGPSFLVAPECEPWRGTGFLETSETTQKRKVT